MLNYSTVVCDVCSFCMGNYSIALLTVSLLVETGHYHDYVMYMYMYFDFKKPGMEMQCRTAS